MKKTYKKEKHLELLKYEQSLENQGKSLWDEDKKKDSELRGYSLRMVDHLHWESRDQYLKFMEDFVNGRIWASTFVGEFFRRCKSTEKACDMLEADFILLQPNDKSNGFSDLIEQTFTHCEIFNPNPDTRYDYEIGEEVVGKTLTQMKKFYN